MTHSFYFSPPQNGGFDKDFLFPVLCSLSVRTAEMKLRLLVGVTLINTSHFDSCPEPVSHEKRPMKTKTTEFTSSQLQTFQTFQSKRLMLSWHYRTAESSTGQQFPCVYMCSKFTTKRNRHNLKPALPHRPDALALLTLPGERFYKLRCVATVCCFP